MKLINDIILDVIEEFGDDILNVIKREVKNNTSYFFNFIKKYDDYDITVLFRNVYMELFAKRDSHSQDFTPQSLSSFLSEMAIKGDEKWIMDVCAGSGCLLSELHKRNKQANYFAVEFDEDLVFYLIYLYKNVNINGIIQHKNVITNEVFKTYKINNGNVEEILFVDDIIIDLCVSNPPFNIDNDKFIQSTFIAERSFLILPNGILKTLEKYKDKLDLIIDCQGNIFDKTNVSVVVISFKKDCDKITFFDLKKYYIEDIVIERRGGFDKNDKSHYGRIYKKVFNKITDDAASACTSLIGTDFNSICITKLKENIESYNPAHHINYSESTIPNVDKLNELISEYNSIIEACNCFSLTASKTFMREKSLDKNFELYNEDKKTTAEINKAFDSITKANDLIKLSKIKDCNYVTTTESNIVQFTLKRSGNNEMFGNIAAIPIFYNLFVQHQMTMNVLKNKYLSDIRDNLMDLLMNRNLNI